MALFLVIGEMTDRKTGEVKKSNVLEITAADTVAAKIQARDLLRSNYPGCKGIKIKSCQKG